jgi:hypothetical protein
MMSYLVMKLRRRLGDLDHPRLSPVGSPLELPETVETSALLANPASLLDFFLIRL